MLCFSIPTPGFPILLQSTFRYKLGVTFARRCVRDIINLSLTELRIVFVGKTGTGKSSTINTIAGKRLFNATASPSSVTINCQWAQFEVEGKPLLVVDTPGIFDTNTPIPETVEELAKVMTITSPGFHVFIIVMKVGRFTEEEHNSVRILAETFGPELYERAVIVFTGLDDLEADGVSFESFIQSANENLTELFATCSNRIIPFNNRLPLNGDARKPQVRNLMRTIERIMKEKNNSYYTNEVYEAIQKEIEEEIARRLAKKEAERQAEERKEQERMKAQKDLEEEKRKRQMAEEDLEREKQRRQESEERRRKEERDREWQNERMNINQQVTTDSAMSIVYNVISRIVWRFMKFILRF